MSEMATQEANLLLRYPNPNIYPYQRHSLGQPFREESSAFTSPAALMGAQREARPSLHSELAALPPSPDHAAPRRKPHHMHLDTAVQHLFPALYSRCCSLPFILGFHTPGSLNRACGFLLYPHNTQHIRKAAGKCRTD